MTGSPEDHFAATAGKGNWLTLTRVGMDPGSKDEVGPAAADGSNKPAAADTASAAADNCSEPEGAGEGSESAEANTKHGPAATGCAAGDGNDAAGKGESAVADNKQGPAAGCRMDQGPTISVETGVRVGERTAGAPVKGPKVNNLDGLLTLGLSRYWPCGGHGPPSTGFGQLR